VNSPPEPANLASLQARFGAALRGPSAGTVDDPALIAAIVDDGLEPGARLNLYRNNAGAMFTGALERSFPVLARRVGEGYFHRLAAEYRAVHPSRSGDLHWIGRDFPAWLAGHLAGSEYDWLADLARLEWACEEVLVAAGLPAISTDALGAIAPEELAALRFRLQPALRCISSPFPVWSVWRANQPDQAGEAVAPDRGAEHVVVTRAEDRSALHLRPEAEVRFIAALASGACLQDALESSSLRVEDLAQALAWLFQNGLVVALDTSTPGARS
jgi:Putative DNA-binding domain